MITISNSTKQEVREFGDKAWHDANIAYYGKDKWEEEDFIFKASEDMKIVGSVYGKFAAGVLYIDDLVVAEDKRGLGIGKMLIEKAEDFGRKMKGHKSYLVTGKTWQARGFYEKLGYKKTGDFPKHFYRVDFVIYEKQL